MRIPIEHLKMLQNRLDITANNVANINTPSFKEGLMFIEESHNWQERSLNVAQYGGVMPGTDNPVLDPNPNLYIGKRMNLSPGTLYETGNPLDLAIAGEGFFQVRMPDGRPAYTRVGMFSADGQGNVVNNQGLLLEPEIIIPEDASELSVRPDGMVLVKVDDEIEELGQIPLFMFNNPTGLEQMGHNLFLPTEASGEAVEGIAGDEGYGTISSHMLEKSNVDFANAVTNLIEAQRAYQVDLRILKQKDEMVAQAIAMKG